MLSYAVYVRQKRLNDQRNGVEPMNREQWLNMLVGHLSPWFSGTGHTVPDALRVSVGWPSKKALSPKGRVVGQCWSPECSTDKHVEIFISPFLGDAFSAAETLLHELVHACGIHGHRGEFAKCAGALGFEKPWKSTPCGAALKAKLEALLATLPAYPHATLDATAMERLTKKDGTRLVKCECKGCGYIVRTTRKWLDEVGAPLCACNHEPMEAPELEEAGERIAA